jgi:hypothetical protein
MMHSKPDSVRKTMTDLNRVSIGRLTILGEIQDNDPTRSVRQTSVQAHEQGYWSAQAAGHALLQRLDELKAELASIQCYVTDALTGEPYENPRFFEIETAARLCAVSPAATHALSIAMGQEREDGSIRMLCEGLAIASIWESLSPEQRRDTSCRPNIDDFPDHGLPLFEEEEFNPHGLPEDFRDLIGRKDVEWDGSSHGYRLLDGNDAIHA